MPESNRAMAARLQQIADRMDPQQYPYASRARAALLQRQLDATTNLPLPQRIELELQLASELIHGGESQPAIDRLTRIRNIIHDQRNAPPSALTAAERLLALAYMRLGEQQNCIANHTSDSCILPIRGDGIHTITDPSTQAIAIYEDLLERQPGSVQDRWLLNLAHMTLGTWPDGVAPALRIEPVTFAGAAFPRFDDVAMSAGIDIRGLSGGAIMDDFTGDGLIDIICSGWGLTEQLRFFVNAGDGSFTDATDSAHLTGQLGGLNLSHGDYNNDGHLDILILRGGWLFDQGEHPNSLLRNDGDGTFTDVTISSGMFALHPSQTAAWADVNNDGWIDIVIGNESYDGATSRCELWINDTTGTFTNMARQAGLRETGLIKAIAVGDHDNDGRVDLYLSRFGDENVLYRNTSTADEVSFVDVTEAAGVAEPIQSFPAWFFDYDNDGDLDLLAASFGGFIGDSLDEVVLDMIGETSPGARTHLYQNNGDGTFTDVSDDQNISRVLLAMGANFGDIDNDGWLDCYFGTGEPVMSTLVPNVMLRNTGAGFEDVTTSGGFGNIQKGHGVAFGDIDNDGDQDVYVTMGGAFEGDVYQNLLYRNPGNDHAWVTLQLRGTTSNRMAVGARIAVHVSTLDGPRTVHRVVSTGGSFGSSTLQQEIGLGDATAIDRIAIRWPGADSDEVIQNIPMNTTIEIVQGSGNFTSINRPTVSLGAMSSHHAHH